MRKIINLLFFTLIGVILFNNITFAETNIQNISNECSIESHKYTQEELNEIRKIHNKVIEKNAYTLSTDGTITIKTDANMLKVDVSIFNEYIESINTLNDIIKLGVAYFDDKCRLKTKTKEEITRIIYNNDKKLKLSGNNKHNDIYRYQYITSTLSTKTQLTDTSSVVPSYVIIGDDGTPVTTLYAFNIAKHNLAKIQSYYDTLLIYNPQSAYSATVGFWVGKVMEGGDWDYKSVLLYAPYNKVWLAVQRYTTSAKTTEWFGNYNYGFTGRFLFSLSALKAGGDAVNREGIT